MILDRFDDDLEVARQRVIDQLTTMVNQRFDKLHAEVDAVRNRVLKKQDLSSSQLANEWPEPIAVSFKDYKAARDAHIDDPVDILQPSTSGIKRKRSSSQPVAKRPKTSSSGTAGTKNFACKFEGCGQSFVADAFLKRHERIHLKIKPFRCTWPECDYSSALKYHVVNHVRVRHFKLPKSLKLQNQLGITDDRDPTEYIAVDQELVDRRLD